MFQVKAISKDVRKTIVASFMFLFNLSRFDVLCVKKCRYNAIFGQVENLEIPETTEIMEKAVKQGNYKFC